MHLYLLRHADAETVAPTDEERFLSEKGMLQAQRVARFCEAHSILPKVVFTSPLRRAHQTAALVAEKLQAELRTVRWLSLEAQPADVLRELYEYRNLPEAMIVGHEPDFSKFVAHLTGAPHGENFRVKKASLVQVTITAYEAGGGRLELLLPAKLM